MKELAYVHGIIYMHTTITQFVLYVAINVLVFIIHIHHHVSITRTVFPQAMIEEVCKEPSRVVVSMVRVLMVVASSTRYNRGYRIYIHLQILERGASSLDGIHVRTNDGINIFGCFLMCTVFIEVISAVYFS